MNLAHSNQVRCDECRKIKQGTVIATKEHTSIGLCVEHLEELKQTLAGVGSSPAQPDTQRTDTDRIAWLNRSHLHVIADSTEGHDITVRISERVWRQNLRDSIDAAMAAAAAKEESNQ